jgi:hypothetical protein
MLRTLLTAPSPVDILEEPLDTVPSRELGPPRFTRVSLDGRPSMR